MLVCDAARRQELEAKIKNISSFIYIRTNRSYPLSGNVEFETCNALWYLFPRSSIFCSSYLISSNLHVTFCPETRLHEQAVGVLIVELDDAGQLVRFNGEIEWVSVLYLVTNSAKDVSITIT